VTDAVLKLAAHVDDLDDSGHDVGPVTPTTDAGATQTGRIYMGSGAPNNANGSNGDYYFRTDTPGTSNQRIYVKSAGSWTGVV
jgi:hypothetical protein